MEIKKPYFFVITSFVLASAIIILLVYYSFGVVERSSMNDIIDIRLDKISEDIEQNNAELDTFIAQITADNESRAKALAIMILQSPSILNDNETLEEVRIALGVDDINISDKDGIIISGTSAYTGDIFGADNYIEDFMPAIKDKGFSKTVTEDVYGTKRFYTGVSRLDKAGIVQITSTPVTLKRIIQYSDISTVTADNQLLEKGCTAVIDTTTYKYISHTNSALVSKGVQIAKSNFENSKGNFSSILDGEKAMVRYRHYGEDKIIMAIIPNSELYSIRNVTITTLFIVLSILLIVTVLAVRQAVILRTEKAEKSFSEDKKSTT